MNTTDLHKARAAELITLAFGVGISRDQSQELVAAKLAEWDHQFTNTEEYKQMAEDAWKYLDLSK